MLLILGKKEINKTVKQVEVCNKSTFGCYNGIILTCLSKIIKTVKRSLPICNRLRQIHFTNIEKNLGGVNRNKCC